MSAKFLYSLGLCFLLLTVSATAATRVWDGGGADNNWTTAANWAGDAAPIAGDDLVFPANAAQQSTNNNFANLTAFNSLRFDGGAYTVAGNQFSLGTGGITVETGTQAINTGVRLNAAQTFNSVQVSAVLTVAAVTYNGNILTLDGDGQFGFLFGINARIVKRGTGAALFLGSNSFLPDTTTIENGIVVVDGSQPINAVTVNGGALGGTGTVGSTRVNIGGISAGTLTAPTGTLTVQTSLIVREEAAVIIKFAGNTAGGYDQIAVNGTVTLTNCRLVPVPLNNFTPAVGDSFTIIANDGTEAVGGTFAGIAEGAVFVAPNNLAFRITYRGGTGNDVVITRVAYAPYDFDADGKTDLSVFRPSNGAWYLLNSTSGFRAVQFGTAEDKPVPRDFDGDGKADIAVFRPSTGSWYVLRSGDATFQAVQFGASGDTPAPADFDGDGRADFAVFRPSNGTWYELRSAANAFVAAQFGASGDRPVAADYDLDARADLAVFRPSNGTWYIISSITGAFRAVQFGQNGDTPVPADFDNDGATDFAVYRNGGASNFYILKSADNSFASVQWGANGDLPVLGDYDGDNRVDIAVFRPSNGAWYLLQTTGGFRAVQFGQSGDNPIPSALFAP